MEQCVGDGWLNPESIGAAGMKSENHRIGCLAFKVSLVIRLGVKGVVITNTKRI
jgi:hypothetical protein